MGGGNSILENTLRTGSEILMGDGLREPTDQDYQQATMAWTIVKEIDQTNGNMMQKQSILINFYDNFYTLLKQTNPDSKICNESMKRKISFLVDVVKIILMGNTNQYEFSKHIKHFVRKYKDEHVTADEYLSIGIILNETFEKILREDIIRSRHGDHLVSDGAWDRLYRRFMRRLAPIMFPQTSLRINTSTAFANTSAKYSSIITSPQNSTSPKRRLSSGFILTSFTLQATKDRPTSPVSSHSSTLSDDDDNISESELQFLTAFGITFDESEMIGRSPSNDRDFFDEPGWSASSPCNDDDYGVDSTYYYSDSGAFVGEDAGATNVVISSLSHHSCEMVNDMELLDVHESMD